MLRVTVAVTALAMAHGAVCLATQGEPTLPGQSCRTNSLAEWTPQEKWVWRMTCEGKVADFNEASGYGDRLEPKEPGEWPESRVLSARFLKTILLYEPFRSAQTEQGVRIVGAWFREPIDLTGGDMAHELWLDSSRLDDGAQLRGLRARSPVSLEGSVVSKTLNMNDAQVEGHLFMDDGAQFQDVVLRGARIGGQLGMSGSTFAGKLDMNGAQVESHLFMDDGAQFQEVVLLGARIGGQLGMSGSKFARKLDMDGVQVEDKLLMDDGAQFQEVALRGARIRGQIDMRGSTFARKLDMDGVQVEDKLLMDDGAQFGEAVLRGARIRGQLSMIGSTFAGNLNMDSAQVEGHLFMRDGAQFGEVVLRGARIGGQIDMRRSTFAGNLNMDGVQGADKLLMRDGAQFQEVVLRGARIGDQIDMDGSTFAGKLNMNSAQVEGHLFMRNAHLTKGALSLSFASIKGNLDVRGAHLGDTDLRGAVVSGELRLADEAIEPNWQPDATFDLRNARVGRLVARPRMAHLRSVRLEGLVYERLGGFGVQQDERPEESADFIEEWLGKEKPHSRLPHELFARVLREEGSPDRARKALYEGKKHELAQSLSDWRLWQALWLLITWVFIGFGYRVWHAAVLFTLFVFLGWAVAHHSGGVTPGSRPERLGFWYSLDRLLPIIELWKRYDDVELERRHRVYFYFHSLMGYVLATFLLVGLSGLVE